MESWLEYDCWLFATNSLENKCYARKVALHSDKVVALVVCVWHVKWTWLIWLSTDFNSVASWKSKLISSQMFQESTVQKQAESISNTYMIFKRSYKQVTLQIKANYKKSISLTICRRTEIYRTQRHRFRKN